MEEKGAYKFLKKKYGFSSYFLIIVKQEMKRCKELDDSHYASIQGICRTP